MTVSDRSFEHELLVVSPHPDDAELFCGGLIIKMSRRGYRIAVVDLSEAELSTYGDSETRKLETTAATQRLGIVTRLNLGLRNCWFHEFSGYAEKQEAESAAGVLALTIRRIRPEVILAPCHYDRHPDHIQSAKLVHRAIFLAGLARFENSLPSLVPRETIYYPFRTEFKPSFVVDISEFAEEKYRAIECFRSQLFPPPDDARPTLLASPLSLRAIRARDIHIGSYIGVAFGEGYLSRSFLRVDDPIAHSRQCPTSDALFFPPQNQ